ncbi:MAG: UDP-N-acetylmuramate--alanine ligase [Patescibacteria group bacterium]|nr:UDP-N-acetylmuramate--alanine ligase [Patescibacteria group bacterium]
MKNIDLNNIKTVHFIGLGGIGVSAIARMMSLEGKIVSGSDQSASMVTEELEKLGITVFIGHNSSHVPENADLVVYSIAVPPSNPEFAKAEELGVSMLSYPEVLGLISQTKKTVAVSGTHGKTTTTAMLAKIFIETGLDPTVVVGSFLKDYNSNFVAGRGEWLVAEACEYRRSFLNLSPNILVITNIEADHLDYYKDLADIQEAFAELVSKVPADGFIICDPNNENVRPVIEKTEAKIIDYTKISTADFDLKFPGDHIKKDAQMAKAVAEAVGIDSNQTVFALNSFSGTWRRFEYKGLVNNEVEVYDDYAHHPDEVKVTILAMKEKYPEKKIRAIFQPHLYSRTKSLLTEFIDSLSLADEIILVPIYAAREMDDGSVSSLDIVRGLKDKNKEVYYFDNFEAVAGHLKGNLTPDEVILVMGAGDITNLSNDLVF